MNHPSTTTTSATMDLVEMGGRLWTQMNGAIPCQAKDVLVEQNSKELQGFIMGWAISIPETSFWTENLGNTRFCKVSKRSRSPDGILLEQISRKCNVL